MTLPVKASIVAYIPTYEVFVQDSANLLKELEKVEVDFDAALPRDFENALPTKTAFVPVQLYRDIVAFIKKASVQTNQS